MFCSCYTRKSCFHKRGGPFVSWYALVGVTTMVSPNQSWQNSPSVRSKFSSKVSKYELNTAPPAHSHKHSLVCLCLHLTKVTEWGWAVSIWAECRLSGDRAFYNAHTHIHKYNLSETSCFQLTISCEGRGCDCKQRALTGGEMWRELRLGSSCATYSTTTWWLYIVWGNSWMFYGSWHGYQTFVSGNYKSSQPLGDEHIFDTRSWLTVWKCKRKQTQRRGTKVYNLKRVAVVYAQTLSSKNWTLLGKTYIF